jgi:hypothetical protein
MGGDKQSKSLIQVSSKPTTGFGRIVVPSPFDQCNHQVVNSSQYATSSTFGHSGSIFFESHIATIVQACFDQPLLASELEHIRGS